jgi:hypothetical protein
MPGAQAEKFNCRAPPMSAVFYWNKRPLITKWLLFSAPAAKDARAQGRFMDALPDKGVTYLKTINYPAESKHCALLKCHRGHFFWKVIDTIRHHVGLSHSLARKQHPWFNEEEICWAWTLSQLGRKLFTKLTALSAAAAITFFMRAAGSVCWKHTRIYHNIQICALYGLNSASCAAVSPLGQIRSLPATHSMQLAAVEFDRNLQNGALAKVITFGSSHVCVRLWIILFHSCGIWRISTGMHWKQRDVCKFILVFTRRPHTNHISIHECVLVKFIIGFLLMWLWTFY